MIDLSEARIIPDLMQVCLHSDMPLLFQMQRDMQVKCLIKRLQYAYRL